MEKLLPISLQQGPLRQSKARSRGVLIGIAIGRCFSETLLYDSESLAAKKRPARLTLDEVLDNVNTARTNLKFCSIAQLGLNWMSLPDRIEYHKAVQVSNVSTVCVAKA